MPTRKALQSFEVDDLAQFLIGKADDDLERSELEELFYDKYEVDLDKFEELLNDLWPLLTVAISPLTTKAYAGFSDIPDGVWILRKEIDEQFVHAVIHWLGGDELKKKDKGYQRTVQKDGEPEFEITIMRMADKKGS